jgi:DNA repair protein RecO (recombination protein O)
LFSEMDWSDKGIVLSARRHGEGSLIVQLLTEAHGRHAGLVRGGARNRGLYQTGTLLAAVWRARLAEHLGNYRCEPVRSVAAGLLGDPARLAALLSAAAIVEAALPEREPHHDVYAGLLALLAVLAEAEWPAAYVRWELSLLEALGFGLRLERCAATGATDRLVYVSPRSGRAVSEPAGAAYRDRLLPLPAFLRNSGGSATAGEIVAGLALTGYFLERHVFAVHGRATPESRARLVRLLSHQLRSEALP